MRLLSYIQYMTHYQQGDREFIDRCRLAFEIKDRDEKQKLLADEDPIYIWTQKQAINFLSK